MILKEKILNFNIHFKFISKYIIIIIFLSHPSLYLKLVDAVEGLFPPLFSLGGVGPSSVLPLVECASCSARHSSKYSSISSNTEISEVVLSGSGSIDLCNCVVQILQQVNE